VGSPSVAQTHCLGLPNSWDYTCVSHLAEMGFGMGFKIQKDYVYCVDRMIVEPP
jgi:hypothetical protein